MLWFQFMICPWFESRFERLFGCSGIETSCNDRTMAAVSNSILHIAYSCRFYSIRIPNKLGILVWCLVVVAGQKWWWIFSQVVSSQVKGLYPFYVNCDSFNDILLCSMFTIVLWCKIWLLNIICTCALCQLHHVLWLLNIICTYIIGTCALCQLHHVLCCTLWLLNIICTYIISTLGFR